MTKTLIDITMTMRPGMPVWPGDSDFTLDPVMVIDESCPVNVSKLTLSPHTGTHMDSAFHYDPAGKSTADMPLDPYIGEAFVVDARGCGALVEPHHIEDQLPKTVERVLIRTQDHYNEAVWPTGFSALHYKTVEMVAARGCKLVGIDTPSMDPEDSKDMPAHQTIRRLGLSILESLLLDQAPAGRYELIALPLKIAGCDGSPVRAVLRPYDEG